MSRRRMALICVFLLIALGSGGYLLHFYLQRQSAAQIYTDLQAAVSSEAAQPAKPAPSAAPVEVPIDFALLQDTDANIYAWLEIPGTAVAYPVAQHPTDDVYYLNHTIESVEGLPGSIYTESGNARDFSDFNTVLYGHNMKNGTMFGSLKQYRDPDFLAQHRTILIYTPTEKRVYRVFAAVVYSDEHILTSFDLTAAEERRRFLASLSETGSSASQVLDDVDVTEDSRLLTLSTCIGSQPNNRYLVVAVYTGAGE